MLRAGSGSVALAQTLCPYPIPKQTLINWLADMLEERLRAMEAQAAGAAQAAAPPPESQQHPVAAPPYLPAPQFTFQPYQRDPPLYFDSRTASFRPDAAPGAGASGVAESAGPAAAFRFSASAPTSAVPHAAELGLQPQPAGERQVLGYQPLLPVAGASAAPHEALPGPAQVSPPTLGEGQLSRSRLPPGAAAGASATLHGTALDPAPRPQSRNLAESLQAAAAARQREASLAAPASMVAAADALPVPSREASTVVITEVPPSPEQLSQQTMAKAAARQRTEPDDEQRSSPAQTSALAGNEDAAAADVSTEPPAMLSPAKPAAAGDAAPELTDADFGHLPPHLRPKYAAAALKKTATGDRPASRPGSATSGSGSAAAAPPAEAAIGANRPMYVSVSGP